MRFGLSATGLVLAFSIIDPAESIQARFGAHHLQTTLGPKPLCFYKYGCDKIMFDEATQKWKEPRPELKTDGRRGSFHWHNLHNEDISNLMKAAENSTAAENSVVLLGDSMAEGWGRPYFSAKRYLDKRYPSGPNLSGGHLASGIVPFAIGGDRIQDLGYRLFESGGMDALKKFAPKTVFLMIGTNDFGLEENVEVAKKELEILVKQLQASLPSETHLVLQPPVPRGQQPCRDAVGVCDPDKQYLKHWDAARNPAYTYFNQLADVLKSNADGVHTTSFLDCSNVFVKNEANLDLEVSFKKDMLHLSNGGYSKLAACIEQGTGVRMLEK